MSETILSPVRQHRVLQAVNDTCGFNGTKIADLNISGMSFEEISTCCRLLGELGLIETEFWEYRKGRAYFPVRITTKGLDFLSETNKTFWESAEKIFCDYVKHKTGLEINFPEVLNFFQTSIQKFRQEK